MIVATATICFGTGWMFGWACRHVTPAHLAHALSGIVSWYVHGIRESRNGTLEHVSRSRGDLTYSHQGREYKIVIPLRRGPRSIRKIINDHGDDVTDTILPYSGPAEDFHRQSLTPEDLGYKFLTLEMQNGHLRVFTMKQPIVV